jgi:hypothetical protein
MKYALLGRAWRAFTKFGLLAASQAGRRDRLAIRLLFHARTERRVIASRN